MRLLLLRKLNQAGYECIFLEGPHLLPSTSKFNVGGNRLTLKHEHQNAKAWFLFNAKDPGDATLSQSKEPITFLGLDDSLQMVEKELQHGVKDDNPHLFTAILGFSQGSVLCHILSVLAQRQPDRFGAMDAAVIASGAAAQHVPDPSSPFDTGRLLDRERVQLSSLHLVGEKDGFVNPQLSLDLADIFVNSKVVWHDKGHLVSQKSAVCSEIVAFLNTCRAQKEP